MKLLFSPISSLKISTPIAHWGSAKQNYKHLTVLLQNNRHTDANARTRISQSVPSSPG